jgi:hypothetical protein
MRGTLPNIADAEYIIDEDAQVNVDGEPVARLVDECLGEALVKETAGLLREVHGDLTKRGSVIYRDALMSRERPDETLSYMKVVPPSLLELLTVQNARLGLGKPESNFLGYMDKEPLFPSCRQTALSLERPDFFEISKPLVREVEYINKCELPHHWARQREFMASVSQDFKYNDSFISTLTVNKNLRACYHTDAGDFRGGMGNLVVLELGEEDSGMIVMAEYRIAFRVRPTQVLLMNVHSLHGNLPLTVGGERLTVVGYAREHINECP